jgi:FkbM family methyltransferase
MTAGLRLRQPDRVPYTLCAFPCDLIGREIAVNGTFEAAGIAAAQWLCEQGVVVGSERSTFLDVGANIGVYTVALAQSFSRVVAFEPHPIVNQVLALNIAINDLGNVTSCDYGLSDTDSKAELWEGGTGNMGMSSIDRGIGTGASYAIRLRHAATAVRETTDLPVAFVKIDVEGHEPKVVAGLRTLLAEQHPVVAFEANDAVHNDDILGQFRDLGYTMFLALGYSPRVKSLWFRVAALTVLGVRTTLKPVSELRGASYPLVFALPPRAAAKYASLA